MNMEDDVVTVFRDPVEIAFFVDTYCMGDYEPTDNERYMIRDAIAGYMDFVADMAARRRATALRDGSCAEG